MRYRKRLEEIVKIAFQSMFEKLNGGLITIDNEASLQLHLSSIIKTIGDLFVYSRDELFTIELEKAVSLKDSSFEKSKTSKAKIDIFLTIEDQSKQKKHSCAIELKYFKKANHREPNNRYDVFKDIGNLEKYGQFSDYGVLLVATDHDHYINKVKYSKDTEDFDFRDGSAYTAGTRLEYRTEKPYGPPMTLNNSYEFKWQHAQGGVSFMLLEVEDTDKENLSAG